MPRKPRDFKSDFVRVDTASGRPHEDLPEVTDEMLDRAVYSVGNTVLPTPRPRGRPKGSGKKVSLTVRIDRDVIQRFREEGKGWQTRMNNALREWLDF